LAFIVTLCSLYDTDARGVSIKRYANHVWRGKTAPADWRRRFKSASKKAARLYQLRNHYFAHVNEITFRQNLFQEARLTYQGLSELMAETWSLVSDLTRISGSEIPNSSVIISDLQALFPKIKLPLTWADSNVS
jgi:hypothetical protein